MNYTRNVSVKDNMKRTKGGETRGLRKVRQIVLTLV